MRSAQEGELGRTLGLREAPSIGVGTMIGAGVFVFQEDGESEPSCQLAAWEGGGS